MSFRDKMLADKQPTSVREDIDFLADGFLLPIASAIGRPFKIDTNTLRFARGRFARICVEIDLSHPVVGKVCVQGNWHKVEYEGLHIICTFCGCYGHVSRNCALHQATTAHVFPKDLSSSAVSKAHDSIGGGNPRTVEGGDPSPPTIPAMNSALNVAENQATTTSEMHGEWLIVSRKKGVKKWSRVLTLRLKSPTVHLIGGPSSELLLALNDEDTSTKAMNNMPNMLNLKNSKNQDLVPPHARGNEKDMLILDEVVTHVDSISNLIHHTNMEGPCAQQRVISSIVIKEGHDQRQAACFQDFSILAWNIRGVMNMNGRRHARDLVRKYRPSLIFLLETQYQFANSKDFWNSLGYRDCGIIEATSCAGVNGPSRSTRVILSLQFPSYMDRELLWDHLVSIRNLVTLPWLLLGDFIEILLPSEVRGGQFNYSRAKMSSNVLEACGLMDLDAVGSMFTWFRRKQNERSIFKRLDRGLSDCSWQTSFPDGYVENINRLHSDHCLLLVRCGGQVDIIQNRSFRFQAAWTTHKDYLGFVQEAWNHGVRDVVGGLTRVKDELIFFNKTIFGNIFRRKRRVEARLRGIQRTLEEIGDSDLIKLEAQLRREYYHIMIQEELLWFQKSREHWVKFGDKNTKFFHYQTIVWRTRNKIHGLFLDDGTWCTDPELMRKEAK
ncbi:hypothetical protein Lal_00022895, partial [Lupinus albus]